MNSFGNTVRSTRTKAGITQVELAARVGLSQTHLSHIEIGTRTTSVASARAICTALGLGPPWPAVAGMENLAAEHARERGIAPAEAYAELVSDLKRALDEYTRATE
jgi:transcriptional regulator with XRE-family HTH domain